MFQTEDIEDPIHNNIYRVKLSQKQKEKQKENEFAKNKYKVGQ